jgi:succinyl-diaminopimelate desuccinylase
MSANPETTDPLATDPLALAQALIRCPSVTPADMGALDMVEKALTGLGFACHRLRFSEVDNLYARLGKSRPNFCFAGHTDVVPPGDGWQRDPFGAQIEQGMLYGRGAADMKTAIAAFIAATARLQSEGWAPKGSISLLLTGDEEGPAVNGTTKVLDWLREKGETLDHCIVGEPTASAEAGDTIKIGRRGSMYVRAHVEGVQGHSAYPKAALNPIPILAALVNRLADWKIDDGTEHFDPSTLAFTTLDVGNPATNVTPAEAHGAFNIRFNDAHTPESLMRSIESFGAEIAARMGGTIRFETIVSGTSFLTAPGPFTDLLRAAAARHLGREPAFSTSGGTSDARFIKDHCPVAELGLSGASMHKRDECVSLAELERLTAIYKTILELYFARAPL